MYLTLCCALAASAAGAYLHILMNLGGLLTTLGCLGSIMWLLSTPPYEEVNHALFFFPFPNQLAFMFRFMILFSTQVIQPIVLLLAV